MKKTWIMSFIVLVLSHMLCVSALAVDNPSLEIKVSEQYITPSAEITAELIISNNPGVAAMNFHIAYDTNRLQLISFEDGQLSGWMVGIGEGENAIWVDENGWGGTGSCLKLKFRVLDDAEPGMTTITITDLDIVDIDEEPIKFSVDSSSVIIHDGFGEKRNVDANQVSSDGKGKDSATERHHNSEEVDEAEIHIEHVVDGDKCTVCGYEKNSDAANTKNSTKNRIVSDMAANQGKPNMLYICMGIIVVSTIGTRLFKRRKGE